MYAALDQHSEQELDGAETRDGAIRWLAGMLAKREFGPQYQGYESIHRELAEFCVDHMAPYITDTAERCARLLEQRARYTTQAGANTLLDAAAAIRERKWVTTG